MIELNNISKNYKTTQALKNLSLNIKSGEVLGFIGPNGAGKTTTIKIITGLINDFSGSYKIDNLPFSTNKKELNQQIGYLPQNLAFHKFRTVKETLILFGKLSGLAKNILSNRVNEVLNFVNLFSDKEKNIEELSGGMVRRLGFAQAILHKPKFLILDEPFAGLDPQNRHSLKKIIKQTNQQGTTILFSSHILSDVNDLADKIGVLNNGQLKYIGEIKKFVNKLHLFNQLKFTFSEQINATPLFKSYTEIEKINNLDENNFIIKFKPDVNHDVTIHKLNTDLTKNNNKIKYIMPLIPTLEELFVKYLNEDEGEI